MYWDVITVKPLEDYRLYVEIKDGRKGIFDVKPYLDFGVFKELKNPHYFNRVGISYGAITWPNEQDIAPETLVAELRLVDQSITQTANHFSVSLTQKVPPSGISSSLKS